MFFEEVDFETFNEEYIKSRTKEIENRRKKIQEKLLDINSDVRNVLIKKYDLHNHWKTEHITSLLFPCEYNHGVVNWIGIRYGKSKAKINLLNEGKEKKDEVWGISKI